MRIDMKVILLLGSSSTGKSTLCGELAKNHQWKVSDTDKFYNEAKPKAEDAAKRIVASLPEETKECLARYKLTDALIKFPITGELHFEDSGFKIDMESFHKESTEELLKKAGIQNADIPLLAVGLREVVKQSEATKEITIFWGLEPFYNAYLEYTFDQNYESDDTIILDVNPHAGFGPAQILDVTEKYIESYSDAHPDQSIEFFKAIAYCPPVELSKRLKHRKDSGYTGNTATGLYSYEQLSMLINTVPKDYEGPDVIDTLSQVDIGRIVSNHVPETSRDLMMVTKTRNELSRIFGISDDTVKLVTTKEFPCDAVVNTNKADAKTLANILVDEINDCAASKKTTLNI